MSIVRGTVPAACAFKDSFTWGGRFAGSVYSLIDILAFQPSMSRCAGLKKDHKTTHDLRKWNAYLPHITQTPSDSSFGSTLAHVLAIADTVDG